MPKGLTRVPAAGPVLITGATGFLGRHLTRTIAKSGGSVIALSRSVEDLDLPGCIGIRCDLQDAASIREIVLRYKPALIYHLAAYVTSRPDPSLVLPMLQANLNGSVHLMAAAAEAKCARLVLTGTSEENAAGHGPASPYGVSKACASAYARYFSSHMGLPVVNVIVPMTYGPGQSEEKLIAHLISTLAGGQNPQIQHPDRICAPVYVDDVIEALVHVGITSELPEGRLEIKAGRPVRISELALIIERVLENREEFSGLEQHTATGPRSIDSGIWAAPTGLVDGLRATVADYWRTRNGGPGVQRLERKLAEFKGQVPSRIPQELEKANA
jgi:UDP-glucose 4-epimerase